MDRGPVHLKKRLSRLWDERIQIGHRERIQTIQKQIDNSQPQIFRHLEQNPKKIQLKIERFSEIEKNNKILMDKMAFIIQNTRKRTNNRNLSGLKSISPNLNIGNSRQSQQVSFFAEQKKQSLNFEKRLKDHRQIVTDNQALLRRLQSKQSNFDVLKWHKDEIERKKLLKNLQDFKSNEIKIHHERMANTLYRGQNGSHYSGRGNTKSFIDISLFGNSNASANSARNHQNSQSKLKNAPNFQKMMLNHQLIKKQGALYHKNIESQAKGISTMNSSDYQIDKAQNINSNISNQNNFKKRIKGQISQSKLSQQHLQKYQQNQNNITNLDNSLMKNNSSFLNVKNETIKYNQDVKTNKQSKSPRSRTVEAGKRRIKKNKFIENNEPNKTQNNQQNKGASQNQQRDYLNNESISFRNIQSSENKQNRFQQKGLLQFNQKFIVHKPEKLVEAGQLASRKQKLTGLIQNNSQSIKSQKEMATIKYPQQVTLFKIQLQMRERSLETRLDIKYPCQKLDQNGKLIEQQETPPLFYVEFQYQKQTQPLFKIYAVKVNNKDETYEIDIKGHKNIKNVMKRFDNEYMMIVENLRIMGDALVLLNPISKQQFAQNLQMADDSISQPTIKSQEGL